MKDEILLTVVTCSVYMGLRSADGVCIAQQHYRNFYIVILAYSLKVSVVLVTVIPSQSCQGITIAL